MDEILSSERYRYIAEAENSLAGCLLVDPQETLRQIRGIVAAGDFQTDKAKVIYTVAASLTDRGKDCDAVLIQAEAVKNGLPLDQKECADLMRLYTTTANAAATAQLIHEAAQARAGRTIGNALAMGEITSLEALGKLQELLTTQTNNTHTPLEAANSTLDYIVAASQGESRPFVSTGYPALDAQLAGGIVASGLFTLAARPGTGKTTAALNIADNVAKAGGKVLYVSLEMDERQLWVRRAAALCGLSYSDIYRGRIRADGKEWPRLTEAFNTLSQRPFLIRDTPATVEDIEREARCTEGLSLLVIDHIGLIRQTEGRKTFSRYEFITDTTHRLKQLALSLKLPILALCQLNRTSEQRSDKQPTMADPRDSGAIEEDSDVVCLLFREAQYLAEEHRPKPWEAQPIDFIVAKNRHGMTGTVTLDFYGMNARILERESYR